MEEPLLLQVQTKDRIYMELWLVKCQLLTCWDITSLQSDLNGVQSMEEVIKKGELII